MVNNGAEYELYYVSGTCRLFKGTPRKIHRELRRTGELLLGSTKEYVKIGYPTITIIYEVIGCDRVRAIDPTDFLKKGNHDATLTRVDYENLVQRLNDRTVNFDALYSMYKVKL